MIVTDATVCNEFAKRLDALAMHMLNAMSQGGDGRIYVTTEMAEDMIAAAAIVRSLKVVTDDKSSP